MDDQTQIDSYLRKFRWALSSLPEDDKKDIYAEMESHILDKAEHTSIGETLEELGSPIDLAASYIEAHQSVSALAKGSFTGLIKASFPKIKSNIAAQLSWAAIILSWLFSILMAFICVMKLIHPENVGLWSSETAFFLGYTDNPQLHSEILGQGVFLVLLLSISFSFFISKFLARFILRHSN